MAAITIGKAGKLVLPSTSYMFLERSMQKAFVYLSACFISDIAGRVLEDWNLHQWSPKLGARVVPRGCRKKINHVGLALK
jgi:hypothetical protein